MNKQDPFYSAKKIQISVLIDGETYVAIKQLAQLNNCTDRAMVRKILKMYTSKEYKNLPSNLVDDTI